MKECIVFIFNMQTKASKIYFPPALANDSEFSELTSQ